MVDHSVQTADHYFLSSARLGFRHWSLDDISLARELWGDLQVSRWIGGPFSAEEVQRRLVQEIESQKTYRVQYWPVFVLTGGEFVGCGGLRPYKIGEEIYEMGLHLRPAYWGRGFALEAGRAIISFAFASLRVKGLFAGHHPENAASRKVLDELGFRFTHEEFYAPTGLLHPSYLLTAAN